MHASSLRHLVARLQGSGTGPRKIESAGGGDQFRSVIGLEQVRRPDDALQLFAEQGAGQYRPRCPWPVPDQPFIGRLRSVPALLRTQPGFGVSPLGAHPDRIALSTSPRPVRGRRSERGRIGVCRASHVCSSVIAARCPSVWALSSGSGEVPRDAEG